MFFASYAFRLAREKAIERAIAVSSVKFWFFCLPAHKEEKCNKLEHINNIKGTISCNSADTLRQLVL
jgi:hypothetical protein